MELPVYAMGVITALIVAIVNYLAYLYQNSKDQKTMFDVSNVVRQAVVAGAATVTAIISTKYVAPYIGSSSSAPTVLLDTPKFE